MTTELQEITEQKLTVAQLKMAVPSSLKTVITPELVDQINQIGEDPELRDHFRDNLLGFSTVLQEGKYKVLDYINAVRYVCYKARGDTNAVAYAKTFPDRYQRLIDMALSKKDISAYVSSYSKSKLVTALLGQVIVPLHIMYDDYRHQAVRQLANLMLTAKSEKVQSDSADRLLTHLKPPEESAIRLSVTTGETSELSSYKEQLAELASIMRDSIASGSQTAKQVAEQKILQGSSTQLGDE